MLSKKAELLDIPGSDRISIQLSTVKFSIKYSTHFLATFPIFS